MHVIFWALYVFLRGAGLKEDFSWWWWWHSLRTIWCNYTPHLFIVQTNMGQKYPGWCQNHDSIGVTRSSTQQVPHSLGNVTVCLLCAVGWQGLGWLGQQQPCPHTWPHTSPRGIFWTNTEGELVVFPPGISAQRQVNHQAEAVLGIPHRLQLHPVPSLHHAPNFQGPLKIQMKTNTQSTDLPEGNCWLSSEQSFGKTYFSCFPFLAVLSGLFYFYPLRLITIRHGTHFLLVSHQARCSRLPLDCYCTLHASSWSFVLQQREGRPVKACSLPVTPASSHLLH